MGKTLLKVKCQKCHLKLLEFERGPRPPGGVLMHVGGFTGKGTWLDKSRVLTEGLATATCPRCDAVTEFDAKFLREEARPDPGGTLH